MTTSAHALFRAMNAKPDKGAELGLDIPKAAPRKKVRRDHDFYKTGQPEAVRGLLARDGDAIRACGSVWEPACGDGAL